MKIFYVYEHWRPDLNQPFWVGKGHGRRSHHFKRNHHYNCVVQKLSRLGMCVEVKMVECGLEESEAFALERTRISFWRARGIVLTNYTDGGEGLFNLSSEVRKKIGDGRRGKPFSEEAKKHLSKKQKERFQNPEEREKISKALQGRSGACLGRKYTDQHRANLSKSHLGLKDSPETKAKKSAALTGRPVSSETRKKLAAQKGWKHSEETKQKMREAKAKRRLTINQEI